MNEDGRLARNIAEVWGAAGEDWLRNLPALLACLCAHWSLTLGPPFSDLSYNYVTPVTLSDGARAVLKIGVPDKERLAETDALPHYGPGMVRVLASDTSLGALLLERLEPGEPLSALTESGRDDEATIVAAGVLRAVWRPAPPGLNVPTVTDWVAVLAKMRRCYEGGTGPLPSDLVEQAEHDFAELSIVDEPLLLHGDFHHGNVLSAQRAPWLAIDPKGLIGPRGYDVGNFLRSNVGRPPDARRVLDRRLDILSAELDIGRDTLRRWGIAQAVLSAWWSIEGHGDRWQDTISVASLLSEMGG
jgi:streptomycin 6-kinase